MKIEGNIVDIPNREIYPGEVVVREGRIVKINRLEGKGFEQFILPGFIDSHVHIESSMLIPSEFARLAVVHGTVATVSDPHEIANVCGMRGVEFMIDNGNMVPFKFNFGAPSCVPATVFETAGAVLDVEDVTVLLQRPEIKYLSEMMNFPAVLNNEPEVMEKIHAAHRVGKPVDGHAPGLRGASAKKYAEGIADKKNGNPGTDHECFTKEEALDKLAVGMKILIREGSAAKNFEALIDLLNLYPNEIMFCSDDKHPDSLEAGHINQLCARAVEKGIDVFNVLQAACVNPALHYKLDVGLLRPGDPADFIVVQDLQHFKVLHTFINGTLVAENGRTLIDSVVAAPVNQFNAVAVTPEDFKIESKGRKEIAVIEALDGQLITKRLNLPPKQEDGFLVTDPDRDILKIAVINRYKTEKPAISFIKNLGLKQGAIASSVAHDSHNIIVVGANDESIARAANLIIAEKGGVSAVSNNKELTLPLPVAGLMSAADGYKVAAEYTAIDQLAKEMGSSLEAPFMTLSFMALLVIPALKLSDKGLFDGEKFEFVHA